MSGALPCPTTTTARCWSSSRRRPASLAPLGEEYALHRRLAELLAREFGGSAADHLPRVADALAVVERICRAGWQVASHPGSTELVTGWERYVEVPLGRRPCLNEVSVDVEGTEWFDRPDPFACETAQDEAIVAVFLQMVAATVGAGLLAALQAAADELVRQNLLPAAGACSFVRDPQRVHEAAEQVRVLPAA